MENTTVKFKVAMDAEQAKLENYEEVVLEVEFPEDCEAQLKADALKTQIIRWQGQIRKNWTKFLEDGLKEKIVYGQPLYETRTRGVVVRKPTEEEVQNYMAEQISKLTPQGVNILVQTGNLPSKDLAEAWKS